jgi:3-oxo-5-alpha-steroid 4-dehydrogenase 1
MALSTKTYKLVCQWAVCLTFICLVAETLSPTAYGRFGTDSTIAVSPRVGWWLMELPCSVVFPYLFWYKAWYAGGRQLSTSSLALGAIFSCHYLYRGWYYPYNLRVYNSSANFSLLPAAGGWLVTATHAVLNAEVISKQGRRLTRNSYLNTLQFAAGILLYYTGLALIIQQDNLMRDLRSTPGPRYRIPRGGLWDYATSAQYTSELIGWFGCVLVRTQALTPALSHIQRREASRC